MFSVAIVGGGWAGVYAAWRLTIDSGSIAADDVCLFEARGEPGGRTYTVKVDVGALGPLMVDIGAYRYSRAQHLPSDLIQHLNLSSACYQPSCMVDPELNATLYKIVDRMGNNAGYGLPIKLMVQQMTKAGVHFYMHHALTGIFETTSAEILKPKIVYLDRPPVELTFANGVRVRTQAVVLNMPRKTMQHLNPNSLPFQTKLGSIILRDCFPCPGINFEQPKVYAIYEDPWWLTKLGIKEGTFDSSAEDPPLLGRYHDGPVHRASNGSIGAGALEVVYTESPVHPEVNWYYKYQWNFTDPLDISRDHEFRMTLHKRLMEYHHSLFSARAINISTVASPVAIVLAYWDVQNSGFLTAPVNSKFHRQMPQCPMETCLDGISDEQYVTAASAPTGGKFNVFVANNDFTLNGYHGDKCCWAENSLTAVEKILHDDFQLPQPTWLDSKYYQEVVLMLKMKQLRQSTGLVV